jgi:hypothetical protein
LGMKAAREKRGGRGEQGGLGEEGAAGKRHEGKGSLRMETLSSRKHWWPL